MSTESTAIPAARAIRMSDAEWNELLVTAVNAGYKNRTEYIRATLKGERLWQSAPPPSVIMPSNPIPATLQVEMEQIAYQATLEALRREVSEHKSEIAKLRNTAQEIKPQTVLTTPIKEKKPVHRFSLSSIVKRWPEARQNRYSKLGSPPDEWLKAALETAYDMLDELE